MSKYHSVQETTVSEGMFLNTLQALSMLPHLAYMSIRLFSHKDIMLKASLNHLLFIECTLPTSSARRLAHALRTGTKVNLSGVMPSCCICWKSCIIFSGCQALTLSLSFFFHEKMVQLQCPWSHCSQLCCHPWRFLWVIKLECLLCHLVLEIGKIHINQTREIQIKL